jgi:hemerythrin superfamily protein
MIKRNLTGHAISEELTIYPAMEKWLGEEGKALTKNDFAQHRAVQSPSLFLSKSDTDNSK